MLKLEILAKFGKIKMFTGRHKDRQKNDMAAFTLAEVLITLGIIGIVAALTIPTLIQSYQETAYINQFKETYSIISQAYISAAQENGTADTWDVTTDSAGGTILSAYNNMKPYSNYTKDCLPRCNIYSTYKTTMAGSDGGSQGYNLYLANGATLLFNDLGTGMIGIGFDCNGAKPPNQWGVDFFTLKLTVKNGAPFLDVYSNTLNRCTKGTDGGWYGGMSCPYWILKHGNMDYLHRNLSAAEWAQ